MNKNNSERGIHPVDISKDFFYISVEDYRTCVPDTQVDVELIKEISISKGKYLIEVENGILTGRMIAGNEIKGKYIVGGCDRNNDLQWRYIGTGHTIFIGSVFTFGFLGDREEGGAVSYGSISWEKFDEYRTMPHINFMGHKSTANLVKMNMCRVSIKAYPGDIIVWSQYDGDRLEEGSTTLPEGAKLVPMEAKIYSSKFRAVLEDVRRWFK